MSAAHTPGPWEFVQAGSGNFPTWNVRIGDRGFIRLPATADMDVMDADARLIACAPELLALAYQYANDMRYPPTADSRERRLAAALTVIAKAEGR
jgi:hypothetical protein